MHCAALLNSVGDRPPTAVGRSGQHTGRRLGKQLCVPQHRVRQQGRDARGVHAVQHARIAGGGKAHDPILRGVHVHRIHGAVAPRARQESTHSVLFRCRSAMSPPPLPVLRRAALHVVRVRARHDVFHKHVPRLFPTDELRELCGRPDAVRPQHGDASGVGAQPLPVRIQHRHQSGVRLDGQGGPAVQHGERKEIRILPAGACAHTRPNAPGAR